MGNERGRGGGSGGGAVEVKTGLQEEGAMAEM
jgi:hypothetical protein